MTGAVNTLCSGAASDIAPGRGLDLICPVSSQASLRAAIDNGADTILLQASTRHLSLSTEHHGKIGHHAFEKCIHYAHDCHVPIVISIQLKSDDASWQRQRWSIDAAAELGADAVTLSDISLMLYSAARYPQLRIHYAAPASGLAVEAINLLKKQLGIARIVLPCMTSLAQIRQFVTRTKTEIELANHGSWSSTEGIYEINRDAQHSGDMHMTRQMSCVRIETDSCQASEGNCALIEEAMNDHLYADNVNPVLNTLWSLPKLHATGVSALRIETNAGSSTKVARITRVWREAIDVCLKDREAYAVQGSWVSALMKCGPYPKSANH